MKISLTNNYKIASNDCLEQIYLKTAAIMTELNTKGKVKKTLSKKSPHNIQRPQENLP